MLSSKPLVTIWMSVSWCFIVMTKVRFLRLRLLISGAMIVLLSFFNNLRWYSQNVFTLIMLNLTHIFNFGLNYLKFSIGSKRNKHNIIQSTRGSTTRREWVIIPKTNLSDAAFWKFSLSFSLALEVLSNWTLTWNSLASSLLVFSARKLFSNRNASMVWFASSILVESSSHSNSTSLSFLVANL